MLLLSKKEDWLGNVRGDILAGLVVALALIPEAIAFSIIAGVDPKVGLYASFCIAVVTAIVGGRPGMISAATGAMALLMVTLVKDHGLQVSFGGDLANRCLTDCGGLFKAWAVDELCVALGCYRLRQRISYFDLYGAAAGANECDVACVRHDRGWLGCYLFVSAAAGCRQGHPFAFGVYSHHDGGELVGGA